MIIHLTLHLKLLSLNSVPVTPIHTWNICGQAPPPQKKPHYMQKKVFVLVSKFQIKVTRFWYYCSKRSNTYPVLVLDILPYSLIIWADSQAPYCCDGIVVFLFPPFLSGVSMMWVLFDHYTFEYVMGYTWDVMLTGWWSCCLILQTFLYVKHYSV